MSVLLDINSWKVCSIVCQYLSENVSVVWCLEKCIVLFGSVTPWKCEYCLIWTLKKCPVSFGSNPLKLSILLDMKSEKVFTIVYSNFWKWEYFLIFWSNVLLLYALGFHACIFWPLGWLWLKNNFVYIWFSFSFSSNLN